MNKGGAIRLSWAQVSETGMRASNQDAIGAARNGDLACFAIADGTGGHHGGEVAARIAIDTLIRAFCDAPEFGAAALSGYVGQASGEVAQARRGDPELADMSTTVATLLVDQAGACAVWAHLGDTRIYLFRAGRVHIVTRDHSLAQQLVDAGYLNAVQLREHPQRNILLAAVGAEGDTPVAVSADPVALEAGDALLACSDGLWEWVREEEMEQALAGCARSEDWLAAMCATADAAATTAGAVRDNYSAYAIRVHHQETAT